MLVSSGIAPLDGRLGGIMTGRVHVLSGMPGTGKSLACLEFLHAAIQRGESAAMLTHDDPADLLAQGEYLGIDLDTPLRNDRLALLRYQLDFTRRFGRASHPAAAFDELRALLGSCAPRYIAIDSVAPILDAGTAAASGIAALLEFLEGCGATALLTYPGDLDARYDRRLEPLIQRAAAVIHLSAERDRTGVLEVRKARYGPQSLGVERFSIRPGAGLVRMADAPSRRQSDVPAETRRRVLLLGERLGQEVMQSLEERFLLAVRELEEVTASGALPVAGVVLIRVRRESLESSLALVRQMRARGVGAPIALVTSSALRAIDRTRALRAGADDFLGAELHPEELLLRVERLARQGRSGATIAVEEDPATLEHQAPATVLDEHGFRSIVQARIAASTMPFFTLVRLTPAGAADERTLDALAATVHEQLRVDGGDFTGRLDGSVMAFLHSARRKDVPLFLSRLRDVWRARGGGELEVQAMAYPADASALHSILEGVAA